MAKKTPVEMDEARLKKKVRERLAGTENPEGNAALRGLHKRLKRVQRKRRSLAARLHRAMGKKAAGAKAEATTGAAAGA
ncbi:MAG: hypothetical protein EPO64_05865 [Nitrospirae bacterium]|nr:MAG: hypothetical protein EPO64_05865 [Nitrospirota bacterium]